MKSWYNTVGLIVFFTSIANFDALPVSEICGQGNPNSNSTGYPWTVEVSTKDKDTGKTRFVCVGNLISAKTVLTAAHCVYGKYVESSKPEDLIVSLGETNKVGVEKIIVHPDYKSEQINYDADMAILQLKQPTDFTSTSTIKPICIRQGDYEANQLEGASGLVTGLDRNKLKENQVVPLLLNAVIHSQVTCLRAHSVYAQITSDRTLCVDVLDKSNKERIYSGNGLMVKDDKNKWTLEGLAVAGGDFPDTYVIFASVEMFREWIRSNML